MKRTFSLTVGLLLLVTGVVALVITFTPSGSGSFIWRWGGWRLWPLTVLALGVALSLLPLIVWGRRGLGALFIPGLPIVTTGGLLLFGSLFDAWGIWSVAWPLPILALALGFFFAALYTRAVGLVVPAIIVGINALLFLFCTSTGLWEAWAVLWALEPLAVGLALLALNVKVRKSGLFLAGVILCGVGALGLLGMPALLAYGWWFKLIGPVVLVGLGALLLLHALFVPQVSKAV